MIRRHPGKGCIVILGPSRRAWEAPFKSPCNLSRLRALLEVSLKLGNAVPMIPYQVTRASRARLELSLALAGRAGQGPPRGGGSICDRRHATVCIAVSLCQPLVPKHRNSVWHVSLCQLSTRSLRCLAVFAEQGLPTPDP